MRATFTEAMTKWDLPHTPRRPLILRNRSRLNLEEMRYSRRQELEALQELTAVGHELRALAGVRRTVSVEEATRAVAKHVAAQDVADDAAFARDKGYSMHQYLAKELERFERTGTDQARIRHLSQHRRYMHHLVARALGDCGAPRGGGVPFRNFRNIVVRKDMLTEFEQIHHQGLCAYWDLALPVVKEAAALLPPSVERMTASLARKADEVLLPKRELEWELCEPDIEFDGIAYNDGYNLVWADYTKRTIELEIELITGAIVHGNGRGALQGIGHALEL